MIVNQANLAAMSKSFQALFVEALESGELLYPRFTTPVPSSTRENVYAWLGEFPMLREWVGDRVIRGLREHDFSIRNKSFEATISVDRDDIEDDNIGVYRPMVQALARNARHHPEKLIADLVEAGSAQTCYDGQYFFDADHPVGTGVVSNYASGAGIPWYLFCTRLPLQPFIFQTRRPPELLAQDDPRVNAAAFMRKQFLYGVDYRGAAGYGLWQLAYRSEQELTADNYAAARAAMMSLTNDDEEPLNVVPDLLVVPPALEGAARDLLLSERTNTGATNKWRGSAEPLAWTWLA